MYKSIRPGKIWYDTDGKRIQAHGGSIIFVNNIFYWYGENKEGITGRATGERCKFWHHGVKLYSSIDLYNWKDEGYVIKESDDPNNPFYPTNIMDRPHILYNEKTNKFVMWAKTSKSDFDSCAFSVCIGDSLKNMNFINPLYRQPGQIARGTRGTKADFVLYWFYLFYHRKQQRRCAFHGAIRNGRLRPPTLSSSARRADARARIDPDRPVRGARSFCHRLFLEQRAKRARARSRALEPSHRQQRDPVKTGRFRLHCAACQRLSDARRGQRRRTRPI